MSQIAFFFGDFYIYWYAIVIAAAAVTAIVTALLCRAAQGAGCRVIFIMAPIAILLSAVLSRFIHWYCCPEQYESFLSAMTDLRNGGFSIFGVFLGCLLTVLIMRWTGVEKNTAELLDCIAPAAAIGICIGRMGAFFTSGDKGKMIITSPAFQRLPFAVQMGEELGGEWQFATFIFEGVAAAIAFVFTLLAFARRYWTDEKKGVPGQAALMFFSFFGCTQAVLESTRYDALFFRSNGFVSLMQIISCVMAVASLVIFSVIAVKRHGFKKYYVILWGAALLLLGGAGALEYLVQRYGDWFVLCYLLMISCMLAVFGITYSFFHKAVSKGNASA